MAPTSTSMYALDQDLARRRLRYPRPLPTLPDVLVIDIPERFAGPSLPLGRYYPIIVETDREQQELDAWLGAPRAAPVVPDLLDQRQTQLSTDRITIATYDPPDEGWPFVLLCHWPAIYTAMVRGSDVFARGTYTTEVFATLPDLVATSERMLAVLASSRGLNVTLLPRHAEPLGRA